ncbi:MAG: DUF1269 domain-containing protein [Pseudomonadota bacterium]
MEKANSAVYVFNTHEEADEAIRLLNASGFDMKQLSLVGKGYHTEEHPVGFYSMGDRIKAWGGVGAFWGGIWGLLLAPAVFFVPGLGVMAMAGPLVSSLVGALEGAVVVGGASAVAAALTSAGVTEEHAIRYETALKAEKYVLVIHGNTQEIETARSTLGDRGHSTQLSTDELTTDTKTDHPPTYTSTTINKDLGESNLL